MRLNYLLGEGARGRERVANQVAGGDVRDVKQLREAAGVGAFPHPGAPQEHPLHSPPVLPIPPLAPGRRRQGRPAKNMGPVPNYILGPQSNKANFEYLYIMLEHIFKIKSDVLIPFFF